MCTQHLAHGDIKDENILVDRDYNAWLIDFGAAASINQRGSSSNFLGTLHYAAPEVLLGM